MQVVIDIPEDLYNRIFKGLIALNSDDIYELRESVEFSVRHGKVLPKGHGRLIDADELKKYKYHDNNRCENAVAVAQIDWAPTIIEADKED